MNYSPVLIGANVRSWRARRGIRLHKMGVSVGRLCQIERGDFDLRQVKVTNMLFKLAERLEVPLPHLLDPFTDPFFCDLSDQAMKLSPYNRQVLLEILRDTNWKERNAGTPIAA